MSHRTREERKSTGKLTIAKAIPTNAPIPLTIGYQTASNELVERVKVAGTAPCRGCFPPKLISSHSPSNHGNKLPSPSPASPQDAMYCHELKSKIFPSVTGTRGSSCKCVMITPYAMPKMNSSTLLLINGHTKPLNPCFRGMCRWLRVRRTAAAAETAVAPLYSSSSGIVPFGRMLGDCAPVPQGVLGARMSSRESSRAVGE